MTAHKPASLNLTNQYNAIPHITSVAAVRGRSGMYVYGAAKALASHWLTGLRHELFVTAPKVRIIEIRPGPIATPMTAGLTMPLTATVGDIQISLVKACAHANGIVYLPGIWRLIMGIMAHLPGWVWHRLRLGA